VPGELWDRDIIRPSAVVAQAPVPSSVGDLFGVDPGGPTGEAPRGAGQAPSPPGSPPAEPAAAPPELAPAVFGFVRSKAAYGYEDPEHWALFRTTVELGAKGDLGNGLRWRASGRVFYDPVYASSDFYPGDVRDDQRLEARVWETYLDAPVGDWELRLGRQHVVWGELVGLFVADVVSPRDLREFILPDLDAIRIPQWALRAERLQGNWHTEALWVPVMTYDEIGERGADFYPFRPPETPGLTTVLADEELPGDSLANSGYGARAGYQGSGWDASLLFYSSPSRYPALSRQVDPGALTVRYEPVHRRIDQLGGAGAVDLGFGILRGELVYTLGLPLETAAPSDGDGLASRDVLDYVAGLSFGLEEETRLDLELFQRYILDHDEALVEERVSSGALVQVSTRWLSPKVVPELLYVHRFDDGDWNLQARIIWELASNWRVIGGVQDYGGPSDSTLGRYDATGRVFGEVRYSF
jgi:hypothetical protein